MHTLILGFDAFDPRIFEHLSAQGRMPNLTIYVEKHGYAHFTVTNPPQSEVSWTSIATGLDPGGHGIFDFVHRDPASYALSVSLLPTKRSMFGTAFVPPFSCPTIFDYAAHQGFPATSLWWPATFPARPESPVRTLPGLGTPDIHGRLGVGTLFSTNRDVGQERQKTAQEFLEQRGKDRYAARLHGPARQSRRGTQETTLDLQLEILGIDNARLQIAQHSLELRKGQWSPIFDLSFRFGLFAKVPVLVRAILTQIYPEVRLYFLPLQLHPLHPLWRYGTSQSFVKQLWKTCGPFLTLGWPQDTTGLEDRCISDEEFLQLCDSIFSVRERMLMHQLQHFTEGILAAVFDTLDRVQHMFSRDRPDLVERWYEKLDALVGRVDQQVAKRGYERMQTIIVSDHGFSSFDYKVHLNRWLIEHGYLVTKDQSQNHHLQNVEWSQTKAYALGLNSLYLNIAAREGQGCVQAEQVEPLVDQLRGELGKWTGPDGQPVAQTIWRGNELFHGPYEGYGPDLLIGYSQGYRGSAQTGLGQWETTCIEKNDDHWGADHCVAAQIVPGVLFASADLANFPHPSFRDIPPLAVGATLESSNGPAPPPPPLNDEDQKVVAERLKSLGYL